jgi:hypothetical protein
MTTTAVDCPSGKIIHVTFDSARAHADELIARDGGKVRPYKCPECNQFHVGHPKRAKRIAGADDTMTKATIMSEPFAGTFNMDTPIEEIGIDNPMARDLADLARIRDHNMRMSRLTEPEPEVVRGLWDDDTSLFARYRVELRFTGKVMGGIPRRPDIIEGWLRKNTGVTDEEELRAMTIQTLKDIGQDVPAGATYEEMVEASKKIAQEQSGNTFKRDANGLYLEDRNLKAMLKESCNIVFPWDGGANKFRGKTPRSALAEWVFVDEPRIHFGRMEPDGRHLQVGQVSGPQGPRSTLTYYDFISQPTLSFHVLSFEDRVTMDQWKRILIHAQRNGLGALRSQSFGQFRVTAFDKLPDEIDRESITALEEKRAKGKKDK